MVYFLELFLGGMPARPNLKPTRHLALCIRYASTFPFGRSKGFYYGNKAASGGSNNSRPQNASQSMVQSRLPGFLLPDDHPRHVSRDGRLAFQRRANATAQIEAEEAMQAQRAQQIVSRSR